MRSGKTVASLVSMLMTIADAPVGPLLVLAGRTLQTIERNLIEPLMDPALFGPITGQVHHTRGSNVMTILGRTVHIIGAADARAEGKLRGLSAYLIVLDEATLLPEDFVVQAQARASSPGARILMTTNPGGPRHWLRRNYLLRADELGIGHWHFKLDDNPFLDADYVAALKRELTGVFYARAVEGRWVAAEGSIYQMFDESRHVVDELPPIVEWIGVGVDYGQMNALHAVLVGLGIDQRLYVAGEWRYSGRERQHQLTDVEYSERIRGWLANPVPGVEDVDPRYTIVDPSAASFITQAHRDGLNPWPADNAVMDGIRLVSSLFALDKLRIHRSASVLVDELQGYAWDERAGLLGIDQPLKIDDHGCDSLRYALKTTESTWRHRVMPSAA